MNVGALIRILGAKGMSADDIADVVELAMPAEPSRADRKRERDRVRIAERREGERQSQESRDKGDIALQGDTLSEGAQGSLSPTPPNLPNPPNLSQEPPIVPQKSARKARPGPAKGAFARFWADYPNKVGKLAAEKAYPRAWAKQLEADPDSDPDEEILSGLHRCKDRWEPEFIPNPLTFLNQGRWMDQPKDPLPNATGPPGFDLAKFNADRAELTRQLEAEERAA